jgi:hypothetical protein
MWIDVVDVAHQMSVAIRKLLDRCREMADAIQKRKRLIR